MTGATIISATSITRVWIALGGDPPIRGRARAFYRDGDNPQAVSLDNEKGVWWDHRDGKGGGVLSLIRSVLRCDSGDAVRWLEDLHGMPIDDYSFTRGEHRGHDIKASRLEDSSWRALSIWRSARPSSGTPVETYMRSRGLSIPPPATLRFHTGLKHPTGNIWLAMVGLVTRGTDDVPLAIHRTFLARSGTGKAPVDPQRMMLGPCRGGAVRLAPAGDILLVGEGIETCLAAMQATRLPAWAALSTCGLRTLDLPSEVVDVIVLADGDDPGEAAAQDCGYRWKREGRRVRIARPPRGFDFNDLLLRRARRIEGDAA